MITVKWETGACEIRTTVSTEFGQEMYDLAEQIAQAVNPHVHFNMAQWISESVPVEAAAYAQECVNVMAEKFEVEPVHALCQNFFASMGDGLDMFAQFVSEIQD